MVQLDLFGEVEAAERESEERRRAREEWRAGFERADWVAPWDTAGGMTAGQSRLGWRCPDPACSQVEPNEYVLHINHGWDPNIPGLQPFDGRCHRLRRHKARREGDTR